MLDLQRILKSSQLPTVPTVAIRLLELTRDPEVEIDDIVDTVKSDPAIAAKILKATNSSFFGFKSEITSLARAVPLLGTTVVTSLAMSFSLVEAAMPSGPLADHYREYWKQCVVQSCAAERLADPAKDGLACEYFLAGLLIDLGKLAMLKTFPEEYVRALTAAAEEELPLCLVEQRDLGLTHVEVGVALMTQWKLPLALVDATRLHDSTIEELQEHVGSPHFELIRDINLAAAFGDYFCAGYKGHALKHIQQTLEGHPHFTPQQLGQILNDINQRIAEAENLFPIDVTDFPEPADLMAEASHQLAELAMREHAAKAQATALRERAEKEKEELESQNKVLQQQALHDPLTRLYNRNFFEEAIQREVSRCARSALPIGVIFADIDKFKSLNDNYGHPFGDYVLKRVSKTLNGVLRQSDVLARYGGEEFIVLVNEPTENGLTRVAERLRAGVEADEVVFGDEPVPVTISVGGAIAIPGRDESDVLERLVREADEAMYDSKKAGRNQCHIRSLLSDSERRMANEIRNRRFSRWLVNKKLFDVQTLSKVLAKCSSRRLRIGELAQEQGFQSQQDVDTILREQEMGTERFGETAIRLGLMKEEHLVYLLTIQQEDPRVLGETLVRMDLLKQEELSECLHGYQNDIGPKAVPATSDVASVAD